MTPPQNFKNEILALIYRSCKVRLTIAYSQVLERSLI